jgi:hypothetical protein
VSQSGQPILSHQLLSLKGGDDFTLPFAFVVAHDFALDANKQKDAPNGKAATSGLSSLEGWFMPVFVDLPPHPS